MTDETTFTESEMAAVKRWHGIVARDKAKWDADFVRMRDNMDFVSGLQWDGQKAIKDERYVCNITLKQIRQKVATLYAKDPTAEATRRPRMLYQLWDGDAMSLMDAMQRRMMAGAAGAVDMEAEAILNDFMVGKQMEELIDKVCKTLEIVYQYQVDTAQPTFKRQMKALVSRVITCGVGYCRLRFIREDDTNPSSTPTNTIVDRQRQLQEAITRLEDDGFIPNDLQPEDPRVEEIKSLALSLGVSAQTGDAYLYPERLEFDFLPATSVIPDSCCRQLTEFVAARHVTIEYNLPVEEVNAMFDVEVKADSAKDGENSDNSELQGDPDAKKPLACVREILDFRTKTHFYICEGYKGYLRPPAPVEPCVAGFWPLFALTFNDVETDGKEDTRASIFPPSDVDLVRHPQKEWNRSRDTLRDVRNACAPKWVTRKGALSKEDLQKIAKAVPNEVVEVEVAADAKLSDIIIALPYQSPDPAVFSTEPLTTDLMMGGGLQEANLGNAEPNVTATVGTIAEQSRLTVSASNVDDLDGFLSALAKAAGEMSLSEFGFSEQIVKQIVGPGAAWPTLNRGDFINQVYLTIKAASSGRPNQALDIANFERVAVHLINAGANPIGVIEEGVRRMGDQLDITKFLPAPGMMPPGQSQGQGSGGNQQVPQLPPQGMPYGVAPMPMPAA